jgi:hypothetical protein
VYEYEEIPVLLDDQLVAGNQFNNLKMAEVPISRITFSEKFLVHVEQMSLSKQAYDFFRSLRDQKQNAEGLFQTPAGALGGNIKSLNNDNTVIGLFYATSITSKSIFLDQSDLPYPVPPMEPIADDCRTRYNATNEKPEIWE